MRKSVLFAIGIIYLISIVVVTFFGLQPRMDQFKVYMTKIEITTYGRIIDGKKYLNVRLNETEGFVSTIIDYDYAPDNASNPGSVSFSIEGNTYKDEDEAIITFATISNSGELVFYEKGAVTITITTTDGSKLTDSVLVVCR